jgi:predicted TIM-barrel fold metal-dependent hydrolase
MTTIVDADGHIVEDDALWGFLPEVDELVSVNTRRRFIWPSTDVHHAGIHVRNKRAFGAGRKTGPAEWGAFLEQAGIAYSALYPSSGLAMGNITNPYWAVAVARAYNDWLHATYCKGNPRLRGVALLPLQDPASAVHELRRAVTELGMVAAMLPSRGLPNHLGHPSYWPLYAEAERLGCPLAVHGGNHSGMGFDDFAAYVPIGGLGHPFGQLIALSALVFHGVLDAFPKLRVAFLEAGSAWVSMWCDRMDRSYQYHVDLAPDGKPMDLKEKLPSDYLRGGRLFIGCEGSEKALPAQIALVGNAPFMYASDFPHEVSAEDAIHEIDEIRESGELSDTDKAAILAENAIRFYGAAVPAEAGAAKT